MTSNISGPGRRGTFGQIQGPQAPVTPPQVGSLGGKTVKKASTSGSKAGQVAQSTFGQAKPEPTSGSSSGPSKLAGRVKAQKAPKGTKPPGTKPATKGTKSAKPKGLTGQRVKSQTGKGPKIGTRGKTQQPSTFQGAAPSKSRVSPQKQAQLQSDFGTPKPRPQIGTQRTP